MKARNAVIPAQAGTQGFRIQDALDPRLRGDDEWGVRGGDEEGVGEDGEGEAA